LATYRSYYLRAQLQGDAARTIAGIHLTETNYSQSISLLKERFGLPNKIQNAHMQALLEIPGPVNEFPSLRLFYDSIEVHIRGLSSLGVSKECYGAPIILGKLPVPIRKKLARERANLDWSIDELQTAILKEIRVLETGFYTSDQYIFHWNQGNPPLYGGKKKQSCVYCKGDHSPSI